MPASDLPEIEQACVDVVSFVVDEYRPQLIDAALGGDVHERQNRRHEDNFLTEFDLALHEHYKQALADRLPGFVYLSEEAAPEIVGHDPQVAILVDPLDTSELAVRGLHGYTHLLAYSLTDARPLVAVVGDFYHQIDLYVGAPLHDGPHAFLRTRDGRHRPISVPARRPSDRLLVTNYNMRPTERFLPLAAQAGLMAFLTDGPQVDSATSRSGPTGDYSRIGVDFGSIGLCHVATGATDVFVEFAKGFALWDLLPGQLILECAGGTVCNLDGTPLAWPTEAFADIDHMTTAMRARQPFVAASSHEIAKSIAATLDPSLTAR